MCIFPNPAPNPDYALDPLPLFCDVDDFCNLLMSSGVQIITKLKRNMRGKLMLFADRILLQKKAVIESINDQLKNISQVEHTRHHAHTGFLWNVAAALIAYCHQPKKPSIFNPRGAGLCLD